MTRLLRWFELRLATPIYEAIVPPGAGAKAPAGDYLSGLSRAAGFPVLAANLAAVVAVSLCAPLLIGRWRSFHALAPSERQRCLERMQSHRLYPVRLLLNVAKISALLSVLPRRGGR
jgi:hypothetical protein